MINKKLNKISIILTAYNHERFIKESIISILNQTYDNFELIIIDDGSHDKTREIIKGFVDERIKTIFKFNEGPSVAVNLGVSFSESKWIALMSGDDISLPNRIEEQYNIAKRNDLDFVFSKPELINENGIVINDSMFPFFSGQSTDLESESFNKLFYEGNFICAPTTFMRKESFLSLGGFDVSSLQLQDFALWIKMVKKCKFRIMEMRLVKYRIHSNNLSGTDKNNRIFFENLMVYRNFFENVNWEFAKASFKEISFYSKEDDELFEIEKSFIYINHKDPIVRIIGIERLYSQMNDKSMRHKIQTMKKFYLKDLFKLTNEIDLSEKYNK